MPKDDDQIPIQCPKELSNGVFSNLCITNFNQEEFVLDFIFLHPNTKTGDVRSRVVLHPDHVRRLVNTLQKNLKKYDQQKKKAMLDDDDESDGMPPITINLN
ncbi:MAG: DUF3467 domain-containing protein [Candidatus Margulisbacteria bacterium]|jgi:hypothetical protein|nr:DUF3467 domain-containing protein [Candidatus Margulisiibacteriota bacterium]